MHRTFFIGLASLAVVATACTDANAPASQLAVTMASAFSSTPAGFSNLATSYGDSNAGAFKPEFGQRGRGPGDHGFGDRHDGPGFGLGLMGGGLRGPFFGDGLEHFHNDSSCAFSSATGQVSCAATTRDGLTIARVFSYRTASGQAQAKIDSTTNTITSAVTVSGTVTRRDSSTSTIAESSTETITGLAAGSTQRTINGASAGTEKTSGTSAQGAFTANRATGDTITGVVIPVSAASAAPSYPTAGTIIRSMSATVTISGQSPAVSNRREVVTYDGSATAKVVITQDGTTQNCTLPLPHGHLSCQ